METISFFPLDHLQKLAQSFTAQDAGLCYASKRISSTPQCSVGIGGVLDMTPGLNLVQDRSAVPQIEGLLCSGRKRKGRCRVRKSGSKRTPGSQIWPWTPLTTLKQTLCPQAGALFPSREECSVGLIRGTCHPILVYLSPGSLSHQRERLHLSWIKYSNYLVCMPMSFKFLGSNQEKYYFCHQRNHVGDINSI